LTHIHHFKDLFRFLCSLTVYYCGIYTVIVLAAVYAREVMGFDTAGTLMLILLINITAAIGALMFGYIQDRLGSKHTLALTLLVWIAALVIAFASESRAAFWLAGNLVGLALGSSQSAGRALVGQFAVACGGVFWPLGVGRQTGRDRGTAQLRRPYLSDPRPAPPRDSVHDGLFRRWPRPAHDG
jgi:predicted MFS family arabinose efflux permease